LRPVEIAASAGAILKHIDHQTPTGFFARAKPSTRKQMRSKKKLVHRQKSEQQQRVFFVA
jgi:hypothetical protein